MAPGLVHIPRACIHCDRVWLISSKEPDWACPHCARYTEVVPGESYQAADQQLFERIEAALHARRPSASLSHALSTSLNDAYARSRRPARFLPSLIEAVPELQFVQTELGRHEARVSQALGMVLLVLTAHLRAVEARRAALTPATEATGARRAASTPGVSRSVLGSASRVGD